MENSNENGQTATNKEEGQEQRPATLWGTWFGADAQASASAAATGESALANDASITDDQDYDSETSGSNSDTDQGSDNDDNDEGDEEAETRERSDDNPVEIRFVSGIDDGDASETVVSTRVPPVKMARTFPDIFHYAHRPFDGSDSASAISVEFPFFLEHENEFYLDMTNTRDGINHAKIDSQRQALILKRAINHVMDIEPFAFADHSGPEIKWANTVMQDMGYTGRPLSETVLLERDPKAFAGVIRARFASNETVLRALAEKDLVETVAREILAAAERGVTSAIVCLGPPGSSIVSSVTSAVIPIMIPVSITEPVVLKRVVVQYAIPELCKIPGLDANASKCMISDERVLLDISWEGACTH